MAIKIFTANIGAGDETTADGDLTYKIYGSANGFTTAIAITGSANSDANVGLAGSTVTISNVDVGLETTFKIKSVDEAGNESIISDSFSLNKGLEFDGTTQSAKGTLNTAPNSGTITIESTFKMNIGNTTNRPIALIGAAANAGSAQHTLGFLGGNNDTQFRVQVGDGTNEDQTYYVYSQDGLFHTYKLVANQDGTWEFFDNNVSKLSGTTPGAALSPSMSALYLGENGTGGISSNVEIDQVKVNTETFELNEASGFAASGDEGTVITLTAPIWIDI